MKRNMNLIFNICDQCNVKCRHCSNADILNGGQKADTSLVLEWLNAAVEAGFSEVTFVGGEPFLFLDDLRLYCSKSHELGIKSCIITNGYWAKTKNLAVEILQSLQGLSSLLVSSDTFHLEHIDSSLIKNALDACIQLNISVALNATCAAKSEKKYIWEIYSEYKNLLFINTHMLMPIGAAKDLPLQRWVLDEKINELPAFCGINSFLVEMDGEVHACCNAILSEESLLYVGNMKKEKLSVLLQKFLDNPLYKFIRKQGPRGIGRILKDSPYYSEFRLKQYTCECDFCVSVLGSCKRQQYIMNQISRL